MAEAEAAQGVSVEKRHNRHNTLARKVQPVHAHQVPGHLRGGDGSGETCRLPPRFLLPVLILPLLLLAPSPPLALLLHGQSQMTPPAVSLLELEEERRPRLVENPVEHLLDGAIVAERGRRGGGGRGGKGERESGRGEGVKKEEEEKGEERESGRAGAGQVEEEEEEEEREGGETAGGKEGAERGEGARGERRREEGRGQTCHITIVARISASRRRWCVEVQRGEYANKRRESGGRGSWWW
eukprot:749671-Hanusia_phi.AAC.7